MRKIKIFVNNWEGEPETAIEDRVNRFIKSKNVKQVLTTEINDGLTIVIVYDK